MIIEAHYDVTAARWVAANVQIHTASVAVAL